MNNNFFLSDYTPTPDAEREVDQHGTPFFPYEPEHNVYEWAEKLRKNTCFFKVITNDAGQTGLKFDLLLGLPLLFQDKQLFVVDPHV